MKPSTKKLKSERAADKRQAKRKRRVLTIETGTREPYPDDYKVIPAPTAGFVRG